jgi:hypothetical protein
MISDRRRSRPKASPGAALSAARQSRDRQWCTAPDTEAALTTPRIRTMLALA